MSEVVPAHQQPGRLEEAKNIALGWRIIGQITPHSLEEAIQLLRDSSAYATTVYELLSAEISEKSHRQG